MAPLPIGVLVIAFSAGGHLWDLLREGIVRHAGLEREEASSRQRLGVALIRNVAHAERGFEGIVSKRLGSPYVSGRSRHWIKNKNPQHPAVKRKAEEDWGR